MGMAASAGQFLLSAGTPDTDRTLVLPGAAAVDHGIVDTVLHDQAPATLA